MKQDIPILKVENIAVAVVKELNEEKTVEVYNVYLLNLKKSKSIILLSIWLEPN